ncbi:hypothetical protein [Streptomyces sp. NPDC004528]|uniref:deoxynucleotide monophosphate kinase family protein n=1 Tax=Streptomyces sp. NPDC004528 TaxID=3154550 RepID=UPI0033B557B6
MNTLPEIIGLGGYAGAGKDTVANLLVEKYDYRSIAFGDAVRDVLEEMNPLIPTPYGAVNLQWVLKDVGWGVAKREYPEVRRLMQRLGGSVREHVGVDAWVTAALRKAVGDRVVFTDVRHRNELGTIRRHGAVTIWIGRPNVGPLNSDVSENSLTSGDFHTQLINDGSREDLALKVSGHMGLYLSEAA